MQRPTTLYESSSGHAERLCADTYVGLISRIIASTAYQKSRFGELEQAGFQANISVKN